MNEAKKRKILTDEQHQIVAELTADYNIKEDDIIFFSEKPEPFFSYTATCEMLNKLINPDDIDIQPIPSVSENSLSLKCNLTIRDGKSRGGTGVVNYSEMIDGEKMTDSQIHELASSRAIRNALKNASIDLMYLHRRARSGDDVLDSKPKSAYADKLAEAHALGQEVGIIHGQGKNLDKRVWYGLLWSQYQVESSNELNEHQLSDFVALLRSMKHKKVAA